MRIMATRATPILAAILAALPMAVSAQAGIDPELLALVDPSATQLGGIQAGNAKATPFGQFLVTQLMASSPFSQVTEKTGFDPYTDLTEILAARTGSENGEIFVRGAFQTTQILSMAQAQGATAEMHGGVTVITGPGKEQVSAAFLNATILVVGTKSLVEGAIDRWVTGATVATSLAGAANTASATAQAWFVSGSLAGLLPANEGGKAPPAITNLANSIQAITAGLTFGDQAVSFSARITEDSTQDAMALSDLLGLLRNLRKPDSTIPAPQITADGVYVNLTSSIPEADAEALFLKYISPRLREKTTQEPTPTTAPTVRSRRRRVAQ